MSYFLMLLCMANWLLTLLHICAPLLHIALQLLHILNGGGYHIIASMFCSFPLLSIICVLSSECRLCSYGCNFILHSHCLYSFGVLQKECS